MPEDGLKIRIESSGNELTTKGTNNKTCNEQEHRRLTIRYNFRLGEIFSLTHNKVSSLCLARKKL